MSSSAAFLTIVHVHHASALFNISGCKAHAGTASEMYVEYIIGVDQAKLEYVPATLQGVWMDTSK